ncbi:peptidoglycan-binding protein [Aestuariibius sp. 2305UL40-4]|uniref:peptidoglycan-binding domain-containing protein n=1 Tax=Aestuariibius violaceus TaxID=3234132 RepID=UPI00345E28A9
MMFEKFKPLSLVTAALMAGSALPALADDAALMIGTVNYDNFPRMRGSDRVTRAVGTFEDAGFRVFDGQNVPLSELEEAIAAFVEEVQDGGRVVVALAGQFVTDRDRTWYVGQEAEMPAHYLDLGRNALSIESILRLLGEADGPALLALGLSGTRHRLPGDIDQGLGPIDVPDGVTAITGEPTDIGNFLRLRAARPGEDLVAAVKRDRDITFLGDAPEAFILVPKEDEPRIIPPEDRDIDPEVRERLLWERARDEDSVGAYRDYLEAYPRGRYATQARIEIDRILSEPDRRARLDEEALALNRDQRRQIQRDLVILDYNTRGIDGIFGPGTRAAISSWQEQNGFVSTSYVNEEQISLLRRQAQVRSDLLEAEAERERQRIEREDRDYWVRTGADGSESGLRQYLERYPDGLFADQARDRLGRIEATAREEAEAQERQVWDQYRDVDSVAGYREYLERYPNGRFRGQAQDRINALQRNDEDNAAQQRAAAEERALGLNVITARLVEAKLDDLGLDPGRVDGQFTQETRRALRRYQQSRGLPATGYMNEPTVVRLLADSFISR